MSTNFKTFIGLVSFVLICNSNIVGQTTLEIPDGIMPPGTGPSVANYGPVSLQKDLDNATNNNTFVAPLSSEVTTVSFKLANQQYSANYSNVSTGLVFGARSTTAVGPNHPSGPGVQTADPEDFFNILGSFISNPGGPTSNFFTAHPFVNSGQGMISQPAFTGPDAGKTVNGAISVFTVAQLQYDQGIQNNPSPLPSIHNDATRYYYGDLQIEFNRFIRNPVIHIAGLGGSYQYLPYQTPGLDPSVAANWRRTQFSTELQVVGATVTRLSGNGSFQVSGSNILNSSASPDGASVSTTVNASDPIDHIGAASGSVRVNALTKVITIRVYLRGCNASQFAWSAPGTASNNSPATLRNPLTGDTWWVSVSTIPEELIPLASTGVTLTGALNGNDVSLNWKTLTETNTKSFEIERSTDGINYVKVGEKTAAGNSVSEISYSSVDPNMNVPVYYYRLKMLDFDGRFSYSNVVIVRKSMIKGIKTFPNPATDHVNIEFSNAKGSYNVALVNQLGQQVYSKKVDINNTVQYVRIERGTIPAGMYHVSIHDNNTGEVQSEKVLIK
ncbi:MAG TPA: T9SS type A sorting domain-containing protein [Chitinophagaceae bacterium]|jgi:hypothetical protein|nr:T9SS type A sorting domain-containing protein [Chitinophagaceae bacterium]HMU56710.1 T9SS type A sorting domain-containing protein [Chitinophagaceae bacterium]